MGSLNLDNEFKDDPLLGSIYIDFPVLNRRGKKLFITDVITQSYNLLSFSKINIDIPYDLNIISVGDEHNEDVDFLDFEGKGLERYKCGLIYLIRPDGYIVGIFKEINIKTLEKCML